MSWRVLPIPLTFLPWQLISKLTGSLAIAGGVGHKILINQEPVILLFS